MSKKLNKSEEPEVKEMKNAVDGLWVSPDLAEKLRGPEGSRGLEEVQPTKYIQLADVALKQAKKKGAA